VEDLDVGRFGACLRPSECLCVRARSAAIFRPRSYYDKNYSGRTACGERYDGKKFTAAHRTLPFGTHLRVTDPRSHRSVEVTVNDRGPFSKGRVLDLSFAAARALRMTDRGLIKVTAAVQ
jgi:rare lipoprotein A